MKIIWKYQNLVESISTFVRFLKYFALILCIVKKIIIKTFSNISFPRKNNLTYKPNQTHFLKKNHEWSHILNNFSSFQNIENILFSRYIIFSIIEYTILKFRVQSLTSTVHVLFVCIIIHLSFLILVMHLSIWCKVEKKEFFLLLEYCL